VALRISGDKAAFFDCKFYAHQNTLYDHRGRHYFKNCYVTGTVDFIYGRSFYEGAELVALPDFGNPGTIAAQKRNETTLDTVTNKRHYHVRKCGSHLLGLQIISCFGVQGFSFVSQVQGWCTRGALGGATRG
jgi:pectinesterase